jgi:hypothetical protein
MAVENIGALGGLSAFDEKMYESLVKFDRFSRRGFGDHLVTGMRGSLRGAAHGLGEVMGLGYLHAGIGHYAQHKGGFQGTRAFLRGPNEWERYFINAQKVHGRAGVGHGLAPRLKKAGQAFGAKRLKSAGGVLMKGMLPAFAIYGAVEDDMGFGIGLAKQMVGWSMFGPGAKMGTHLGGFLAARTGVSAGGVIGKIPGIKKVAATAVGRFAGAAVGGSIGWLLGGFIAMEAAAWTVGFALHTLPTFAKQYKSDMSGSGFGGDYKDSAGAATMRQRSLQVMGKSFVNARSALGQEASLLHV